MSTDDNIAFGSTFAGANEAETERAKPTGSPELPDSSLSEEDKAIHQQVFISRTTSFVRLAFDAEKFRAKEVQHRLAKILE